MSEMTNTDPLEELAQPLPDIVVENLSQPAEEARDPDQSIPVPVPMVVESAPSDDAPTPHGASSGQPTPTIFSEPIAVVAVTGDDNNSSFLSDTSESATGTNAHPPAADDTSTPMYHNTSDPDMADPLAGLILPGQSPPPQSQQQSSSTLLGGDSSGQLPSDRRGSAFFFPKRQSMAAKFEITSKADARRPSSNRNSPARSELEMAILACNNNKNATSSRLYPIYFKDEYRTDVVDMKRLNLNAMLHAAQDLVEEHGEMLTPIERWQCAILSVISLERATGGFLKAMNTFVEEESNASKSEARNGAGHEAKFRLEDYAVKPSFIISPSIRATLDKHRSEYDESDFEIIDRLTERMPAFQKYSPQVRRQLVRRLQYEIFGPNRVMIKQGHEPKSFYFILSGRVTVYKVEGEMRVDLNELGSGDAFGELALLKGTRRTASVKTNVPCEFFRIDRDDFLDVLKDTAEEDIKQKLDFFTTVPFLAVLPSSNLLRLAELCSKREWPANTVIVREREHVTSLSLIRAGSVRVLRLVPFTKVACNDHRYSLAVCPPPVWPDHSGPPGTAGYREAHAGTSAVSALASAARHAAGGAHPPSRSKSGHETDDSNVVWKLTCTGLLHSKGYFGQESILVSVERHKDASSSSEHHHVGISPPGGPGTSRKSMTAASGRTPRHATAAVAATLSPHSIVTCEPTDIFRINRVDVLKLLTPKALAILEAEQYDVFATADPRELVPNPPLEFGIPLLVIQTAYLASHAWAAHRKKVLRQIVADKKCRRERKIKSFGLLP